MVRYSDVVICGSGSAGLAAATWLARCGVHRLTILEKRNGPMAQGQADGVQCRTVEVFESFGLAEDLLREAYHVLEFAFWQADDSSGISLKSRRADTTDGLSHLPHVILNQARMNGLLLDAMKSFNGQQVEYGYTVTRVQVRDEDMTDDPMSHCVSVFAEKNGQVEEFRARYVLACDGAHSAVRKSLGFQMVGDTSDAVWGVMDVYPQTDFPDIRRKAVLQSQVGNLLIVPREGNSLARFYLELPHGTKAKDVLLEDLQEAARRVFHPYHLHIAETHWWSAYAIGQRLADQFTKNNRVFLTGDACHTHSPKAGQGMNVSLQDGYDLGFKLALVLKDQARPDILETYTVDRQKVAADLIAFDRQLTKAFSSKNSEDKAAVQNTLFTKSGRYTAGLATQYGQSALTCPQLSDQSVARNLVVGMRFPSAQVVRLCDARAIQLLRVLVSDGRFRIVVFAGDITKVLQLQKLCKLAAYLDADDGPLKKYTSSSDDIDSFIEPLLVLSGDRQQVKQEEIPDIFWPVNGKWKMRDLLKVFIDDHSYNSGHGHAYDTYGINPDEGAIAIIRPDQYIGLLTSLDKFTLIGDYFAGFAVPQSERNR